MSRGSFVLSAVFAAVMAAGGALDAIADGGSGGSPSDTKAVGKYQKLGKQMAADVGWTGDEWACLKELWINESGWDPYAVNPESQAYGIPQILPEAHGHPVALGDAEGQIEWGIDYIAGRADYGAPCAALELWESRDPHWY